MPRSIARAAAAVLLVLGATVLAARQAPVPARPSFDELYSRGQQANAGIKTLTARFIETTTSPLLSTPLVARGTLAVERPSRVVLHYEEPEQRTVLIDGNRMVMTWPSRNIREELDIRRTQGRIQKYFTNTTAAELRKEFEIQPREPSERPGMYEVTMVPRRRQIRETLARLDLWVDPTTSLMTAMRMTFDAGDTKLMEFQDVVPNARLDAGTFAEPE